MDYTPTKQKRFNEYCKMYKEAAQNTWNDNDYYCSGYTGANALSFYVDNKFDINSAGNDLAARALRESL